MQNIKSVCGRCHNSCGIIATVEHNQLIKVKGDPDDQRTRGALCGKGLAASQMAHDPQRLTHPLRRVGPRGSGKWEKISWDAALQEIADKIIQLKEEYGPRSIGFYRGQAAGWGFQYIMMQRFCNALEVAPMMGTSECFVPRVVGEANTYGGIPLFSDLENCQLNINWGRQPAFSCAPGLRRLFEMRDRGGKIVVIDDMKFHLGARADQFIFIEPGTDMALALAMLQVIVEEDLWDHDFVNNHTNDPGLVELRNHLNGGNRDKVTYSPEWAEPITQINAEVIRNLAREYATTKGACIQTGHGLEGRVNVSQTARCIALLRSITGHIDQKGCDILVFPSPKFNPKFFFNHKVEPTYVEPEDLRMFGHSRTYVPEGCNFPLLWEAQGLGATPDALQDLHEGITKFTFVQGGNMLRMLPNPKHVAAGFSKTEMNVVCDLYHTETTAMADIILPVASYLERTEPEWFKYDYALPYCSLRRQLVQIGECRSDSQILVDLGIKLGLQEEFPTSDITYYIDDLLALENFKYADLAKDSANAIPFGGIMYNKLALFGVASPDHKVQIVAPRLAAYGFDPLPVYTEGTENRRSKPDLAKTYPLNALTGRTAPTYIHCQMRSIPWLREIVPEPILLINPQTASDLGVKENDWVEVESPRDAIRIKAHLTEVIDKGSVYIPGGWAEANYSLLGIDEDLDPITSQPNYMQCLCLCKVSRITEGGKI
ncbi:MAG: molybdopterin-dependent oxidoreductase [Desulfitobacterium sp.]